MFVDKLAQRNSHLFFDIAGLVHVPRNTEQLGSGILWPAQTGEPFRAASEYGWYDGDGFDIVDRGGAAIKTGTRRKRRLQTWLTGLAFEAFQ